MALTCKDSGPAALWEVQDRGLLELDGTKSEDISASAASVLTFMFSLYPHKFKKCITESLVCLCLIKNEYIAVVFSILQQLEIVSVLLLAQELLSRSSTGSFRGHLCLLLAFIFQVCFPDVIPGELKVAHQLI